MEELNNAPDKSSKPSDFEKLMDEADSEEDLLSKPYDSMTPEEKTLADKLAKERMNQQTGETFH